LYFASSFVGSKVIACPNRWLALTISFARFVKSPSASAYAMAPSRFAASARRRGSDP
jgi:hypothetical protein